MTQSNNVDILSRIAQHFDSKNDAPSALKVYENILSLDPKNKQALNSIVDCL